MLGAQGREALSLAVGPGGSWGALCAQGGDRGAFTLTQCSARQRASVSPSLTSCHHPLLPLTSWPLKGKCLDPARMGRLLGEGPGARGDLPGW